MTERLVLRPIEAADASAVYSYRSDSVHNEYQSWIPSSLDDVNDFITNKTSSTVGIPGTWFQLVIIVKGETKLIGDIGIHFIESDKNRVELGCTLNNDFRNKGYATEALSAVIGHLFEKLHKQYITASVDPRNTSSIRLLERLGFKKASLHRSYLFIRGEWVDDLIYAITKEDWTD